MQQWAIMATTPPPSGTSTPKGRRITCPRESNPRENGQDDISCRRPFRSRHLSFYSTPPAPKRVTPTGMNLSLSSPSSSGRSTPARSEINAKKLFESMEPLQGGMEDAAGIMDLSGLTPSSGRSSPTHDEIDGMRESIESSYDGIEVEEVSGPAYERRECNYCDCGVKFQVTKEPATPKSPAKPATETPPATKISLLELLEQLNGQFANSYSKF